MKKNTYEQGMLHSQLPDESGNIQEFTEPPENTNSISTSLPVIMFTYKFMELCKDKALPRIPTLLALSLLGNMDIARGFIHKFKVKEKAKEFGCSDAQIYNAVRRLHDVGFASLKLRYGTVSGRIHNEMLSKYVLYKYNEGEIRKEDLLGNALSVGMIHPLQLEVHIKSRTSGGHLRLMLACCLNVDMKTGKLHEKRPCEWAKLAGIHRTWTVGGFDHANESGWIQTQTDYDVVGHMPFVALAHGTLQLSTSAKQENRSDSKDRYKEKCLALYEAFGIQLDGLAHDIIENAWQLLGKEVDQILAETHENMNKLAGRHLDIPIERRRIVEDADHGTIPLRDALPFA